MNIAPYKTSKDYTKLWELAKTMRVICIVDYGEHECRDVAKTIYREAGKNYPETIEISGRGIGYIWAHTPQEFAKQCERDHVEFIEPVIPEPDPIFMSMQTFERLKSEIQHECHREENVWTYAGRKIYLVNSRTSHDCSEHKLLDGTCAVCGFDFNTTQEQP